VPTCCRAANQAHEPNETKADGNPALADHGRVVSRSSCGNQHNSSKGADECGACGGYSPARFTRSSEVIEGALRPADDTGRAR
jgi:hypothetical protein